MDINTNMVNDTLRTMANVTDMLAKSERSIGKVEKDKDLMNTDGSFNSTQPQHQVVQVQLGELGEKKPAVPPVPPVVKKKKETHIHKEFPDDRALTDAECNLALEKAKMEHELAIKRMEYDAMMAENRRLDQLERERIQRELDEKHEKERKEKEQEENHFLGKAFKWVLGTGVGLGILGGGIELVKALKKSNQPTPSYRALPAGNPVVEAAKKDGLTNVETGEF